MAKITLDKLSASEDLEIVAHEWNTANAGVLDLRPLDRSGNSARRVSRLSVALLANLLLGRYTDLDLAVAWPTSDSARLQLTRGGLLFALAQRRGSVTFVETEPPESLERWSGNWRPARGDQ